MNRIATMAIAAAAVAGIAGGTFAATSGRGTDDPRGTGRGPSSGRTPTSTGPSDAGSRPVPLYLAGRTLVDGDDAVALVGITVDNVRSLERVPGGWFVVTATSPQEPAFRGTFVAKDGETTDIGRFAGQWDLDAERRLGGGPVRRLLRGPRRHDRRGHPGDHHGAGRGRPAERRGLQRRRRHHRWRDATRTELVVGIDLDSGRQYDVTTRRGSSTSRPPSTGCHIAGEQFRTQEVSGRPASTAVRSTPSTRADGRPATGAPTVCCRSSAPAAPSSLTVPYDTEGFGPSSFGILDVANGRVRDEFDVPELVTDGVWADNDTLFLHGYADGDLTGRGHLRVLAEPATAEDRGVEAARGARLLSASLVPDDEQRPDRLRAAWIRDFTVPSGTSSSVAISL